MTRPERVVVVGASAAGLTAAETLRQEGYAGALTLIGAEALLPYDRPPLSKQVLSGGWLPDRPTLRPAEHYAGLDIDLRLGRAATGLDLARRAVELGPDRVGFDALILATGLTPRRLPFGHDLAGVHVLHTLDDALALRERLRDGPRTVVVGAGVLGSEIAATARESGADVTLVGPSGGPMEHRLGAAVGARLAALHRSRGVKLRTGVGVTCLTGSDGRVTAVGLEDGTALDADVVVVAIGSRPATDWLAGSGLPLGDGIHCDDRCRAAPGVFAAGDAASWPHPRYGTRLRLEHRTNAAQQAVTAARNLLGADEAYAPLPYYWTDQFGARIQVHGLIPPGAEAQVAEGAIEDERFAVLYRHRGRVTGLLTWNSPAALRRYRELLVERVVSV